MKYELTRDWKYTGGPEGGPGGKVLKAGTVLGTIEINEGVPMTPQMLADAILRKLAREVSEEIPKESAATKAVAQKLAVGDTALKTAARKSKMKVVEDA